ncbi:Hypothetical predicted protein [Mytilus galloprovincialis]|uniref:Uncharacterized protein n=1 Tax=Mytilus galloprovincialis TaxID=29158 RepID=A0A8B6FWJ7_MYTGA|nr:Hypothetical predicted protein [Mytilus galloprovincialis]
MLEKDKYVINLPPDIDVIVLKTKRITIDDKTIDKVVQVAETLLLVIEVPEQQNNEFYEASIITAIHLPGYLTDFCFVSKNCGFLVSWKHISERENALHAREHLFHVSPEGKLLGITKDFFILNCVLFKFTFEIKLLTVGTGFEIIVIKD